ncbi:MAG: heme utilization cystosolic carrier protein HutX [Pseudomonadales bacterium]
MTEAALQAPVVMEGAYAELLMRELSNWQNTTTIILHAGCVFEFKGMFPVGSIAEGYYNLGSSGDGFEGHIRLGVIDTIAFQSREHRGRESHAFVFQNDKSETIFKVFLGRDSDGNLLPGQVADFNEIQSNFAL